MTRQYMLKDNAGTLVYKQYIDNIQAIPDSTTVSIVQADGTDMPDPVEDATCTIGVYGDVSYILSAVNNADLGRNFKATFTLSIIS